MLFMGAMLIGMATGFFALVILFIWKTILLSIIFIDSHRKKMSSFRWVVSALIIDWPCLPFYIYARIRISKNKCPDCSSLTEKNSTFCGECGKEVMPFDEASFSKKLLKVFLIVYAVEVIISILLPIIYQFV